MDRVAVYGHGVLHDRFAESRMRMDVAAELPRIALEELGQRGLGYELGCVGADDVRADHLAGFAVGDDLDEAAGLAVDDGAAERGERKFADPHLETFLSGLLLGQ